MEGIHHRLHRCGLWRHRYPQIGEDIVVYPCPSEMVSVLSVVKNVVEGIHHRWHRCGASADTDIHGLGKVSV